ncbi:MAG: hypothetical protein ACLSXT_03385 [Clostridium butyricum]|uniref:hypothetical protein n=1 Tax=uncultured Clostridium sp. TaxID=59620 RepID=UPI0006E5F12C|nr:hypothetical protein [uncultured Clostridium sp.]KQB76802.1 hypothetical protein AK964_21155 [Clostridium butyricum]
MKQHFFILLASLIVFTLLFVSKPYAATPLYPSDSLFSEGIYKISDKDSSSYTLKFRFLTPTQETTLLILDEDNNVIFRNSKCSNQCDAGIITNKNTLIIITKSDVFLYFNKL